MEPEDSGMRKASHIGLWIIVLVMGGWILWSATHSKTLNKTDTFASGSKQTNNWHIAKNYALASLSFSLLPLEFHGCLRADKLEQEPQQTANEVIDAKQMVNAVVNDVSP